MRRRVAVTSQLDDMEKGQGKNNQSRLCLLAALSAFFWLLLLYFHLVVLGGKNVDGLQQFNSVSLNAESINTRKLDPSSTPVSRPVASSRPPLPWVDVGREKVKKYQNGDVSSNAQLPPPPIGRPDSRSTERMSKSPKADNQSGTVLSNAELPPPKADDHSGTVLSNAQLPPPKVADQSGVILSNAQPPPAPIGHPDSSKRMGKGHRSKVDKYPFMRALWTSENKSDPCGGRYIYVHDIPSKFKDNMLKECQTLSVWTNMCKFITNAGLGPPLENAEGVFSDTGWYATNQFAVDVIFNNRMKQYECLTNDSSLAAAIFVPFYAGFDIARYLWGFNTSMRDAASLDLVDWLAKRPEWGIMGGKDHFLVAGRITWDFRRLRDEDSDWGNKLLFLPAARNMSMLVVESSPWNANDFGIPYPTYFHPAKDADVFVWQDRMRKLERKWLFCFAGAPRPGNPKSIRGQIINECKKSKVCKLLECDLGESKCHSPSSIMQMFQTSHFCLQPQGDSFTRRSAFDAILAGCIPVFSHPASAYTQYTWHLPKNYSTYSVFISENDIRKRNVSIEEILSRISAEQVKQMREEVINLIPRIIYADPRSKLETLKDAFDIAVKAIIDKVTKLRRDIVEGHTDYNFIEEISWKYALLDEGQQLGPHEWDPFFEKQKDDNANSDASSAEAAKNSWKNEQRQHS